MAVLCFALELCVSHPLFAANYYVATNGDNSNSGTLAAPFASIARAQETVSSGDTVYIRGGTYRMQESEIALKQRIWAHVIRLNKSGEPGKPIRYLAYENERPIFDFSDVKPSGYRVHAFSLSGSWLHIRGLEIIGVQVAIKTHTQSICFANSGSHNLLEQLSMHDGQAIGIYCDGGSDNLFLNCDAYRNYDYVSEGGKGGNVDGFGGHPPAGGTGNVFRGCRAWFNSDDGFDCISAHEAVRFENCWAFWNGYSPDFKRLADGNGFKVGGYGALSASRLPQSIPRHVTQFCIAVRNKSNGFYSNHHPGGSDWFNNTAFNNGANFNMLSRLADNVTDVAGYGHKLRNNLSFRSRSLVSNLDYVTSDSRHNSFTESIPISDADFMSLDENQLLAPRNEDGSLPILTFLLPNSTSTLLERGVEIGFPFSGTAPDLGALPGVAY